MRTVYLLLTCVAGPSLLAQTYTWDDKANGQLVADCDPGNPGGEFYWPDNNSWSQDELIGNNPCPPYGGGFMREPSNWDLSSYPDGVGVDVIISSSPAVEADISVDVGTLSITAGNQLRILGFTTLTVNGPTITNDGLLDLDDTTAGDAELRLATDVLLTGSGQTRFVTDDDCYITAPTDAEVLTVAAGHELLALPATVAGYSASRIQASLVNEGTVTVDGGGLQFDTHPKTNSSLIQSTNGGTVLFDTVSVDNGSGTILSETGSTVKFDDATLTGGTLEGGGLFEVGIYDATFASGVTIDTGTTVTLRSASLLTITDSLINHGTVRLDDVGSSEAELRISGDVALNGTGSILFATDDDCVVDSVDPNDVLTIGADQTLFANSFAIANSSGSRLEAKTVNNGTITADQGGLMLNINDKTNNHLIEAINGGKILISGVTVDNGFGTITTGTGSEVELDDCSIEGGLLNDGGLVQVSTYDARLASGLNIGPGTTVVLDSGDKLSLEGTIINDGTLELKDQSSSSAEIQIFGDVSLLGSGTVLFNSNDDNTIIAQAPATDLLTIGPDLELLTGPAAIAGNSESIVHARFANNGTITADTGGLQIQGNDKSNDGLMQTLNGGTLRIRLTTLDNAGGTISLDAAGNLFLSDCTVSGGLITGSGTITSQTAYDHLVGPIEIGAGITATVGTNEILGLSGDVTNHGTFDIYDNSAGYARVRLDADTQLLGSGKLVFRGNDDSYLDSVAGTEVLTNGPSHTITTTADTLLGESRLRPILINQGLLEAREGELTLDLGMKTNSGIFRAADGGTLEVRSSASILGNYDHGAGSLSGGRWEVVADGLATEMDLQGASITSLGAGTEVLLDGSLAGFPALQSVGTIAGTLMIRNQQSFQTTGDLTVSGRLSFGVTDGSIDGFDATRLEVDGNVDFSGAVIDLTDLGLVNGIYEVVSWTGVRSGSLPTVDMIPAGKSVEVSAGPNALFLTVGDAPLDPPEIISISYDPGTNTTTILYQSILGESFGVLGGQDLDSLAPIGTTAVGNGSPMLFLHHPPGAPNRYFYQLSRP